MLPLCTDSSREVAESAVVAAENMASGRALPFFAYVHEAAMASDAARRIYQQPEKSAVAS